MSNKTNKKEHKKVKSSENKFKRFFFIVLKSFFVLLLFFSLAVSAAYLIELKKSDGDMGRAVINVAKKAADTFVNEEPIYVLLLGYSTDEGTTLADTIIYMGYNPKLQKAFMVSIPRDTFIGRNIKNATGGDKINSLYKAGNATKIEKAVKNLLGDVRIDYFITINTKALVKIVDSIGGVEFNVPINMNYDDSSQNLHIHLKEGLQTIDGKKAEGLLRFRHNNNGTTYPAEYGNNDYGRMRTQREFIVATAKQCLEVNDLSTLKDIITAIFDNLETDCSLTTIFSYLVYIYDFDIDSLQMEQLPGASVREGQDAIWVFKHNEEETKILMDNIMKNFNKETSDEEPEIVEN